MKPSRVAIMAMVLMFVGVIFPTASAQGTFSKSLVKSFQSQTIICTKGSAVKKVTSSKPRCPSGFKKKIVRSNQIAFSILPSYTIGSALIGLTGTSSASLPVSYRSGTPLICSISQNQVQLISPGKCTITASQGGSIFVAKAKPVTVSFSVLAQTVEVPPVVVGTRVTSDQPDTVTGFQIKAIYVVPADGKDHSYDTNGYISKILDEGNAYLKEQLGRQLPIDRTNSGYDIQFMKSKVTTAEFMHSGSDIASSPNLLNELKAMDDPGVNRKNYVFFVDVPGFVDGTTCGYASEPSIFSTVAIGSASDGSGCSDPGQSFRHYSSSSWIHENFHSFGVGHFNDSCDLMNGMRICTADQRPSIDKAKSHYVGASALGVGDLVLSPNILDLRVWDGYSNRTDLKANCVINPGARSDGLKVAYCPTGTQTIGSTTGDTVTCLQFFTSVSMDELTNGTWGSIGPGKGENDSWGSGIGTPCNPGFVAPSKSLTVTTPGLHHYRWVLNGIAGAQIDVIWVQ
jgi:hypothetical protein